MNHGKNIQKKQNQENQIKKGVRNRNKKIYPINES